MAEQKKNPCLCPYCDDEVKSADPHVCQACGLTVFHCPKCQKPLPRENEVCPHCGAKIRD